MNAKTELLTDLVNEQIKCASITHADYKIGLNEEINLRVNFNEAEFNEFLNKLDFEYDSGYGCQYLFGDIWLQDGTWFSRYEYDGSEYWVHNQCPVIPSELL